VGAVSVARHDLEAVCLVLAADHFIRDERIFVADCLKAARAARGGHVVTLGIEPDHASTAYGYIQAGEAIGEDGVHRLHAFIEKPDKARAESCL
jgi:mannose-1-phosphate guanylyltransferase/mannose-6-phosphate isomerase